MCVMLVNAFPIQAHLGDFIKLELGKAELKPGSPNAESWDSQPRNDVSLSYQGSWKKGWKDPV